MSFDYTKITAKQGDHGTTALLFGGRVDKTDTRIKAVGKADSFSAYVGVIRSQGVGCYIDSILSNIQQRFFLLMGELATHHENLDTFLSKYDAISEFDVLNLEAYISELGSVLNTRGVNSGWSVYGASRNHNAAQLFYATALLRELEVAVLSVDVNRSVLLQYLNRLSKVLFLAAKFVETELGE